MKYKFKFGNKALKYVNALFSEIPGRVVTSVPTSHRAPRAAVRSGVRASVLAHVPPRPARGPG